MSRTILLKQRDNAPQKLQEWRLKVELQSGAKVLAVRSDNATEQRCTLVDWCKSFSIIPQYAVPYISIQNGVAERVIRTTENSVHAEKTFTGVQPFIDHISVWDASATLLLTPSHRRTGRTSSWIEGEWESS